MIYEGCIQLTAVLIFPQLTGSLLALVRESILPFPARAGCRQEGAQAGLEKGSSTTWASQVEPVSLSQPDIPQKLWAALLRGRNLEWDVWVFQEFPRGWWAGNGGTCGIFIRQPLWSKKDFGAMFTLGSWEPSQGRTLIPPCVYRLFLALSKG